MKIWGHFKEDCVTMTMMMVTICGQFKEHYMERAGWATVRLGEQCSFPRLACHVHNCTVAQLHSCISQFLKRLHCTELHNCKIAQCSLHFCITALLLTALHYDSQFLSRLHCTELHNAHCIALNFTIAHQTALRWISKLHICTMLTALHWNALPTVLHNFTLRTVLY